MDDSARLSRRLLLVGAAGVAGAALVTPAYASAGLIVITHPANKESASLADLATIFTTRKQSWGNGGRIVPFNFPPKHETRVAFDKSVLNMSPDEVARYWIDRRIRGGNAPPKQVGNGRMIARLVASLEGAIGYVPVGTPTEGTRVLHTI